MMERDTSPESSEDEESIPKYSSRSTDEELLLLFQDMSIAGTKPGVLSLVPEFSNNYVPKSSLEVFSTFLNPFINRLILTCNIMNCWKCVKLFLNL